MSNEQEPQIPPDIQAAVFHAERASKTLGDSAREILALIEKLKEIDEKIAFYQLKEDEENAQELMISTPTFGR